jgi:hypothetical protein
MAWSIVGMDGDSLDGLIRRYLINAAWGVEEIPCCAIYAVTGQLVIDHHPSLKLWATCWSLVN